MHEFGLLKLIMPRLEPYLQSGKRLKLVRLRIGELKGVNNDHLHHAFEHLKDDYPQLSSCELEWELSKVSFVCKECGTKFDANQATCPACGAVFPEMATGNEFEIIEVRFE
ncbi:MAG: hydrogenase/urease maturation nickel metallochaperone HypA [bacterium]